MKTLATIAILLALFALSAMSLLPRDLVGARSGLSSPAGWITASALAVVAVAGGWLWWRERQARK
jgi:hypothetical protein